MVNVTARGETRFRLSGRARKIVLITHIASAGIWLGIDVVLGVMVGTALVTGDRQRSAVALQSLGLFAVWPLVVTGLISLASGILLGLGSKYGLIRYWWVAVKLALNVVLVTLVLVLLRPGVEEISGQAGQALATGGAPPLPGDLVFPPIVSGSLLLVAMVLSVFKPWGRTRRSPRTPDAAGDGRQAGRRSERAR